jgi:TolB-like protein/class 3 adenylate cyclase/tetratricopeptide (TPR) repeat protein
MQGHRHAAIMFTDIVGYTALMGSDEDRAFEMLRENREIHTKLIEQFNGSLIKEMGDGMLISFGLASEAVRCAIEIQKVCKEQSIPLKIGIHEGEMVFDGNDVLGDGVNIASRLQEEAGEGSIIISSSVYRDIKNKAGINTVFIKELRLKNVEEPVKAYTFLADEKEINTAAVEPNKIIKTKWYYLSGGIIAISIIVFLIWNYLPFTPPPVKEKSIAVLPFANESGDEENLYFVNGMMEDIRNNLSKIADLRVISKTTTEKYRDRKLSVNEIGAELGVNYLLEGSVQKQGNQVKIHAQLIEVEIDDHIWTDTYQRDISQVFETQTEIAQIIATELYAFITPEEQEIIETIPTTNLTAYDFYLRARDEQADSWLDYRDKESLEKAIILYRMAIEHDSTYARAYTGLALAYWQKHYWDQFFEEDFLDSVLVLTNVALKYDDRLDEAYFVRGAYLSAESEYDKAVIDLEKAIQLNPNYTWAYYYLGDLYCWSLDDYVEGLKNLHKAASLGPGLWLPSTLRKLSVTYADLGFKDKAIYYMQEALKIDNDSTNYFNLKAYFEICNGDFQAALESYHKNYESDSSNIHTITNLMRCNILLENTQEAYKYALLLIELSELDRGAGLTIMFRLGYTFWHAGKTEEAKYYFDKQIEYCLESIRLNRVYAVNKWAHIDLAAVYAFLGEKEKAYQYLKEFDKRHFETLWSVNVLKHDPLFNNIRNEERFQKFLQSVESKYQKEHERVRVWLAEEGML